VISNSVSFRRGLWKSCGESLRGARFGAPHCISLSPLLARAVKPWAPLPRAPSLAEARAPPPANLLLPAAGRASAHTHPMACCQPGPGTALVMAEEGSGHRYGLGPPTGASSAGAPQMASCRSRSPGKTLP